MKKVLLFIIAMFAFGFAFTGCSEKADEQDTTTTTTTQSVAESSSTTETTTEKQSEKQTETKIDEKISSTTTTTKKNQSNPLISDEDMEKIENSNAEVFFTDNPNNKFIIAVSDKYGVKKENLVALVKINAEFPSANVFEFSGKTDSNGELIMNYEELINVYEINEEKNTIVRAGKNSKNNDGISFIEAKILMTLAKEYLIPELPNLKENKRLPE